MTKFNDLENKNIREPFLKVITDNWNSWSEARGQTLNRITNYLFVLNSGGLLASLTYIATITTKSPTIEFKISLWLLATGTLFSIIHATLDYYLTEICFKEYRLDLDGFYKNKLDWEDLVERNNNRPPLDLLLHACGWIGGVAFLLAMTIGIVHITI